MPSKRTLNTDSLSAAVTVRRPRGAGATHSRKPAETLATPNESKSVEQVDQDAIARLAYSYWEARGGQGGSPEDDWFRAEHELLNLSRSLESA